ncbi:MAG: hypothetical protein H7Z74_17000 [Anaerolineae bacterium]|nr:hypothetical protein [Gemmatimonadaceae bacterium]
MPSSLLSTYWYLARLSMRNRVKRQFRRMRKPRYAIAFLLGGAYLWFIFLRPGGAQVLPSGGFGGGGLEVAALVVALFSARWWIFGNERNALAFTQAEVQFLFQGPLSRRSLISYKLFRAQFAILLSSLLWTLLVRGGSPLPFGLRALGFWMLFSTFYLHQLGVSLVRTSAMTQGRAGLRRNGVAIGLFGAGALALAWSVYAVVPDRQGGSFLETLGLVLQEPGARLALLPFRLAMAPGFAQDTASWFAAFAPAIAMLALHYVWVIRSDAAFEEAAVEASAKRAKLVAAVRERGAFGASLSRGKQPLRAWLPLAPNGTPAVAIIWKNSIAITRTFRLAMVARILVGLAIGFAIASFNIEGSISEFLGTFLIAWGGLLVVAGPIWVRNDLRADLSRLELLRSYPLSGASIVSAEVASSAISLTALQLSFFALAYLLLLGNVTIQTALSERTMLIVAAAAILPAVNAIGMCIQNALALLFPEWGRRTLQGAGGIETIGQQMVIMLGSFILLIIALLVPVTLAMTLRWGMPHISEEWSIAIGAALALIALVVEVLLCVWWLGRVFERTEPSVATS